VIVHIMTYERSTLVNSGTYIGLDVHQATISVAVMDPRGKVVMESILETKASTILEFFAGLRGTLWVTFEEGTWAAWLYDLLKPHVAELVVCNPRKNALLKHGNRVTVSMPANSLTGCGSMISSRFITARPGYACCGRLARSYLTIVKDLSRVMNRLKALYRSWAIPCAGRDVYYLRHRSEWLEKIPEAGTRRRAERLYQQLDMLQHLRQQARRELLGTDSLRFGGGPDPDPASVSHQATTLDLQRTGVGNPRQRGIPLRARPTAAPQKAGVHSRLEQGSQP
jgi:hypothetical protein